MLTPTKKKKKQIANLHKQNKRIFLFLYCMAVFIQIAAQNQDVNSKKMYFQGYSGGMMLHTGYLSGGEVNIADFSEKINVQGTPFGIGGLLRFHFGKHLRIGSEGYSSTLHYWKNKSYTSLGWGGLLLDCQWKINKFTVFAGGTIGGGSLKNVTILNNVSTHSIKENAVYQKHTVLIAAPFIGMEYAITQRVHLITKIDCILNITNKPSDFAIGPRVYAGVVFFHGRKSK